jgi:hypothetical protein
MRVAHCIRCARPRSGIRDRGETEWDACVDRGGCPKAFDRDWGRGDRPVIYISGNGGGDARSDLDRPADGAHLSFVDSPTFADKRVVLMIDVEDEAVTLDRMLRAVEPAKKLRLVVLDARRENPFVSTVPPTAA